MLRNQRGFSLIELFTVIGIIGVVATLSWNGLSSLRRRNQYTTGVADIHMLVRELRAEAFGRGAPTVLVVEPSSGRYWGIEDRGTAFALSSFDPANPVTLPATATTDRLITSGTLGTGLSFGPTTGYGTLPAPFKAVPADKACTFCLSAAGGRGAIVFHPGGGAAFSDANVAGGSISLSGVNAGVRTALTIAVLARTGSITTFEKVVP